MKRLSNFLGIIISILFLLSTVKPIVADYGQYGQYGGSTPSQNILIEKMVGKPNTTKGKTVEYVNNLSPADPRYVPNQEVYFKIRVKNTSTVKLTNITIKDIVPNYIEPLTGPGTFDRNSMKITFSAGDFDPDQEKTFYVTMQVLSQDKLPADKGLFCLVNKAEANGSNAFDSSSSQFCVEKQVAGVTQVPKAGPEMGILLLGLNITGIGIGLALKKRVN